MPIPVVFVVVFLWLAAPEFYNMIVGHGYYGGEIMRYTLFALMTGLLAMIPGMLGVGLAYVLGRILPKKWKPYGSYALVSLRNGNGIEGNFFLGSGAMGSQEYYFYYTGTEKAGYRPHQVSVSNNITVFEDDRTDGDLKTQQYDFVFWLLHAIGFHEKSYKFEFRIPKGSLKQNFRLA